MSADIVLLEVRAFGGQGYFDQKGSFTNWVSNAVKILCTGDGMKGHEVITYYDKPVTREEETKEQIRNVRPLQCRPTSLEDTLKYILGLELNDWRLVSTFIGDDGEPVTHFILEHCGSIPACPDYGKVITIHDHRERIWRHANLDKAVCYIHARMPRFICPDCGKLVQVEVPWVDPNMSHSKRLMEIP